MNELNNLSIEEVLIPISKTNGGGKGDYWKLVLIKGDEVSVIAPKDVNIAKD